MAKTAKQSPSAGGQGKPFRSQIVELTEIERIAAAATLTNMQARAAKDVRPLGAEKAVTKGIDFLARPDLRENSES